MVGDKLQLVKAENDSVERRNKMDALRAVRIYKIGFDLVATKQSRLVTFKINSHGFVHELDDWE